MKKLFHLMTWPSLIIVLLDQASKWAVRENLALGEHVRVIEGFFNIVHVQNRGMVFGLLNRPGLNYLSYLLAAAGVCAVVVLVVWATRLKGKTPWTPLGLSFIIGGAAGNLIDRLKFGYVTDFLDFYAGAYHWPAFNIADSAITMGTIWVAFILLFKS